MLLRWPLLGGGGGLVGVYVCSRRGGGDRWGAIMEWGQLVNVPGQWGGKGRARQDKGREGKARETKYEVGGGWGGVLGRGGGDNGEGEQRTIDRYRSI